MMNLNFTYNLVHGCAQNWSQLPHFVPLLPRLSLFLRNISQETSTAQVVNFMQNWSIESHVHKRSRIGKFN